MTTSHWAPTVCIQVPTLLTSAAIHSVRNNPIRNGAQGDDANPEPAMPRFSSLWARPSRQIRLASAAEANLLHEPGQPSQRLSSTIWPLSHELRYRNPPRTTPPLAECPCRRGMLEVRTGPRVLEFTDLGLLVYGVRLCVGRLVWPRWPWSPVLARGSVAEGERRPFPPMRYDR